MKPERWREIEELFHSALQRPPNEQSSFIEQTCGDDIELKQQVEILLVSLEESGDFIENAPLAGAISSVVPNSGGQYAASARAIVGQRIGHYEIQSLIGAGGMGEVYLAHDLVLDRPIAVKILPAQFTANIDQVQRFEREARAASALNHPNIITIHEIGRDGETHFIATEFVSGKTLRERIADQTLDIKEAINIALQIADALTAAHAAEIVHRDIKPENLMSRPDGLVKVLDFGLAKPLGRETGLNFHSPAAITTKTDPDMLMGTLAYLSPEQVLRHEVDHRTDIFSLGIVLYELVMGTRPFGGSDAAVVCDSILRQPVNIPRTDIPPELKQIINRALEKDRNARYQTAVEMRNDLKKLVARIDGGNLGVFDGWRIKAAAGVAVLIAVAIFLSWSLRPEPAPSAPPFSTGAVKRITDVPGWETFPSLSPDGQSVVYASRASGSWDIYLKKIGDIESTNLTPDGRHVDLSPAFSPDGKRIAFSSSRDGQGIFLMDADGRNLTKLAPAGYNPAWSPDGHEIAIAEDRIFDYEGRNHSHSKLFAVNVDTGDRRLITSRDAVQPNWSPNGHRIAFWGVDKGSRKDIWTVAAGGGEPVPVTDDQPSDWNPVWSRDGRYLYFLSDRGGSMNLWRVPIDEVSGRVTGRIEPATLPSANSQHFSFSADGKAMVYVEMNRREGTFQVDLDPITATVVGQPVQITQGIRRYSSPQISEDEKSLVFVSAAEAQEDLYIIDRDSGQLRQITNDAAQDRVPRWSPDNRQIAFLSDRSGKYEIWKVNADGSGLDQITDVPDAELVDAIWSPDGQKLLYQVREAGWFIIDPNKPRESQTPQPLSGRWIPGTTPWAWSPDEKLIVGWQFDPQIPTTGLVIYSFADQKFERVTSHGYSPTWLSDSKRLLFSDLGKLYSFNVETRKEREICNVGSNSFGVLTLSKDNRRLYYSLISTEADIHMLPIN